MVSRRRVGRCYARYGCLTTLSYGGYRGSVEQIRADEPKRRPRPEGRSTGPAAPLTHLQQTVGNRAVASMVLSRSIGSVVKKAAGIRKIVLDANIFDEIARGNIGAAKALRWMTQHDDVYVSWQAMNEWMIRTNNPKQTNTVKRIIEELKIKQAPPAPASVVAELRAKNPIKRGGTILSADTDLLVAADAKALDGEVFSLEKAFVKNSGSVEKTLGVKIASESKLVPKVSHPKPPADQKQALQLLGLEGDPVAGHLPAGKPEVAPAGGHDGGAVGKEAEGAAAKEGDTVVVKEGEKVSVKEGGKVLAKEAEKVGGRMWSRVAAKVGTELLEALVPGPLDAIMLLVDYASAFEAAKEAIRANNTRLGVTIGLASYMVIPRWEFAKGFAHTVIDRSLEIQILGAEGIAENAFNEGLLRGYLFGERFTTKQMDALRQKAFDELHRAGYSVGRQIDDDGTYQFDHDDVYWFAGMLGPVADWFLAEAGRRKEAREDAERERRQHERDMYHWTHPGPDKAGG